MVEPEISPVLYWCGYAGWTGGYGTSIISESEESLDDPCTESAGTGAGGVPRGGGDGERGEYRGEHRGEYHFEHRGGKSVSISFHFFMIPSKVEFSYYVFLSYYLLLFFYSIYFSPSALHCDKIL